MSCVNVLRIANRNVKVAALVCTFLHSLCSRADTIREIHISGTKLYYHYFQTDSTAKGLVFFLHGSAAAFKGKDNSEPVALEVLLEGNKDLVPSLQKKGYDVVVPICHNEYNWLEPMGKVFMDTLTHLFKNEYPTIFLAGFSDGGTGAYRYFYSNTNAYHGLIVFNGYPQLGNFNKSVDYKNCRSKGVCFVSQKSDKIVPYEFLLVEYRRQKMWNDRTHFLLEEGRHEFVQYRQTDFEKCFALLEAENRRLSEAADSTWIYPPADGFCKGDTLVEPCGFRTKIGKGYGMAKSEYKTPKDRIPKAGTIVHPLRVASADLQKDVFVFEASYQGQKMQLAYPNYLVLKAW
jgi:hypothetical protein